MINTFWYSPTVACLTFMQSEEIRRPNCFSLPYVLLHYLSSCCMFVSLCYDCQTSPNLNNFCVKIDISRDSQSPLALDDVCSTWSPNWNCPRTLKNVNVKDIQNTLIYYGITFFIVGFSEHKHALKTYYPSSTPPPLLNTVIKLRSSRFISKLLHFFGQIRALIFIHHYENFVSSVISFIRAANLIFAFSIIKYKIENKM